MVELVEFIEASEVDLPFIAEVYNYYVLNSTSTFHTQPETVNYFKSVLPLQHKLYVTYIIKYNNQPCGYCYLGNLKPRQAYNRSSEVTIYLQPTIKGKGVGSKTLDFLESKAKEKGLKNLIGVITAENTGSIKLFEKKGYLKVGHLKNIGEKFGRLLDVLTYQKEI